jgi:ligand-binding SRPBCC domain-containing protein
MALSTYRHRTQVKASLARVAEFHRDSWALKRLTPPPVIVQMHDVQPLAEGSRAAFTLWMGPVPVHWVAIHQEVDMPRGFSDVQQAGPFACWRHRHSFVRLDEDMTEVVDEIQAEFGRGPAKGLVCRLMWWSLPVLFAYRGWMTKRLTEGQRAI